MSRAITRRVAALGAAALAPSALLASFGAAGAGASTSPRASGAPITIGASISETGPLASFGTDQKAAYTLAVNATNAGGGLLVGGVKHKVNLVLLDNQSNPTTASQQVRDLVLKDGAVALLGAGTPPITVPEALAADQLKVPYLTTNTPTGAFVAGNKSGWKFSWDMFFSEPEQAHGIVAAVNRFPTNHKIALFTDNEPDGVVERPLYKAAAAKAGDKVVGDYTFPVGTTDYTSFITNAKSKGAQIVIGQMAPPDGVTLFKQMKSLGFRPKIGVIAKAGDFVSWVQALGPISNGSLAEEPWSPLWNYPGGKQVAAKLTKQLHDLGDVANAVPAYSVVQVMLAAIRRAGSTDATKINAAIASTNMMTPYGRVRFSSKHVSVMGYAVFQWQGTKLVPVFPSVASAHLQFPMKGFA